MDQEKIGKFIAESRKHKKMTQAELAEKLGVTDKSVGNWENGRNMPDLSLINLLCDTLDITVNDFLSGKHVEEKNYKNSLEENIIKTLDYSTKKVNEKDKVIGIILIIFGVVLSVTSIGAFASESSWGSIYSLIGCIISLIGFYKLIKKLNHRIIYSILYFIIYVLLLIAIDYIGVINIHQAPRFSIIKLTYGDTILYDTLFYDVYRCDTDSNVESWNIEKNSKYDVESINNYCNKKRESRLSNIIKSANNTQTIVISKLTEVESSDKQYVTSVDGIKYERVREITDKEDINNIINLIGNAKYADVINMIGYSHLFQLFDSNNNLLFEFTMNRVNDGNEVLYMYIEDEVKNQLESYFIN